MSTEMGARVKIVSTRLVPMELEVKAKRDASALLGTV
jgi:hypothetical protein